jgi:hypothetical protein
MKQTFKTGDKIKFICTNNEVSGTLTIGKIYEVDSMSHDGHPYVVNNNKQVSCYMDYRFELVNDNSLEARIEKAKSLIGKPIRKNDDITFIPDSWAVGNKYGNHYTNDLDENGLVVYVENEDYIAKVEEAELVKNHITLTDDYDATIEKDFVRVGCQNVPIEKVREIISIWESLHG